jgi:Fe-S cluster assembly protein SufD
VRRLVLVDGVFAPKLSELAGWKGLAIRTLREVLEAGDAALQAQLLRLTIPIRWSRSTAR